MISISKKALYVELDPSLVRTIAIDEALLNQKNLEVTRRTALVGVLMGKVVTSSV